MDDDLALLTAAGGELKRVISAIEDDEMDVVSNCPPWTIRRLASHVLKNQLFWAGLVTGQELMDLHESMAAVPYDGDLAPIADDVLEQVLQLWHTDGVMTARHATPFGELPGSVVINFAVIDAAAHAWDLSASLRRPIDFPAAWIPRMTGVVAITCTEHAVQIGLIKPPISPPVDATDTERLMAAAGRAIAR